MKKVFLSIVLVLAMVSSSIAATWQLQLNWDYDGTTSSLAGFRVYDRMGPVCEQTDYTARSVVCDYTGEPGTTTFTMTSYDIYGGESEHSAPFDVRFISPDMVAPHNASGTVVFISQ